MAHEWIEQLAHNIKQNNRDAAQAYGRAQHQAGIIATAGRPFFAEVARYLQDDVAALRAQLQGDPASAETALQTTGTSDIKLTRSRFPWLDARIVHRDATITLDYAKDRGTAGDPTARKTAIFNFVVSPDDKLSVQEAFGDPPIAFASAEDLARHIIEILFAA